MANLQDNVLYLTMDGVDVATGIFRDAELTASVNGVEITSGSGTSHVQRGAGLKDTNITIVLTYRIGSVNTYIQKIAPGMIVEIDYGIEGNSTGKPRHTQRFLIGENSHSRKISKDLVEFNITASGADVPTNDMFGDPPAVW